MSINENHNKSVQCMSHPVIKTLDSSGHAPLKINVLNFYSPSPLFRTPRLVKFKFIVRNQLDFRSRIVSCLSLCHTSVGFFACSVFHRSQSVPCCNYLFQGDIRAGEDVGSRFLCVVEQLPSQLRLVLSHVELL